jgi:hypothetical protein
MTDEPTNDRPPAFPLELLNRPRPRGILKTEEFANQVADPFREKIEALERALAAARETELAHLELLHGVHEHIAEAVGLIDAAKVTAARKALDAAVVALDKVDFSLLAPKVARGQAVHRAQAPRQLTKAESDGVADLLISHAGVIAGAKAALLKDGPEEARSKLTDAVQALVRHLANHRSVTERE